jgi:hypothetical protein
MEGKDSEENVRAGWGQAKMAAWVGGVPINKGPWELGNVSHRNTNQPRGAGIKGHFIEPIGEFYGAHGPINLTFIPVRFEKSLTVFLRAIIEAG